MWLKAFTIAIVERNTEKLNDLMETIPSFEKKTDIESALSLLQEATKLVESMKDETQTSMIQMQKNIKFLKATQAPRTSSLDISS